MHVELAEFATGNLGHGDFQHDLLRTTDLQQVDDLSGALFTALSLYLEHLLFLGGSCLGEITLGNRDRGGDVGGAGDSAGKYDRTLRRSHLDSLIRHQLMQLLLEAGQVVRHLDTDRCYQHIICVPKQHIRRAEVLTEYVELCRPKQQQVCYIGAADGDSLDRRVKRHNARFIKCHFQRSGRLRCATRCIPGVLCHRCTGQTNRNRKHQ